MDRSSVTAKRVDVGKENTTIIGGSGDAATKSKPAWPSIRAANRRTAPANTTAKNCKSASPNWRAAWPSSKSGAATEVEMKEKKDRVEDALHATRAAVEEGVVAGGGVALSRARAALENLHTGNADQDAGVQIVLRAVESPLRQIVANAGGEPSVVVNKVLEGKGNYGYNAGSGEYGDMIEMGVLDPAKVTRSALQHAASIAGLMLTTDCMIAEIPEEKPAMPDMGGMGGMGGMM